MGTNFENILCRSEKERIRSMYNKTTIRFGVRDIRNNQGLGKGYQVTPTSTLIILDITKTSSNNCLLFRLVPAVVLTLELLKLVKCPPFLFSQLKQLNVVPRSTR